MDPTPHMCFWAQHEVPYPGAVPVFHQVAMGCSHPLPTNLRNISLLCRAGVSQGDDGLPPTPVPGGHAGGLPQSQDCLLGSNPNQTLPLPRRCSSR